jgi:hypothetical protein
LIIRLPLFSPNWNTPKEAPSAQAEQNCPKQAYGAVRAGGKLLFPPLCFCGRRFLHFLLGKPKIAGKKLIAKLRRAPSQFEGFMAC